MNSDDDREKRDYDRGESFYLCDFDELSFPLSSIERIRAFEIEATWTAFGVYDSLVSRIEDLEE